MTKTPMTLMDTLLEEADKAGVSREHVMEQAHYASLNVEQVTNDKFDALVNQVAGEWGPPEQNITMVRNDGKRSPLPKWLHEANAADRAGANRLLRVAYWRREAGYSYVMIKVEVDSKDRPNYYNIVLGSRRRVSDGPRAGRPTKKMPWWANVVTYIWKGE